MAYDMGHTSHSQQQQDPLQARFFPTEIPIRQIAQRMSQRVQRRGTCVYVLRDFIVNSGRWLQTSIWWPEWNDSKTDDNAVVARRRLM